tara:strand:+ start:8440 stop:9630 length:1191 start_codon:yes stop_codon:yes gene_type:complete
MYFQSIDDKQECVGIYKDGILHFDEMPTELNRTWKYSASDSRGEAEYAWLYCGGMPLEAVCPEELQEDLKNIQKRMRAYKKSFKIAKLDFRQHCFFDLVPHDFLIRFLEIKNLITQHVFENYEKPKNYAHLCGAQKLLHKIKHQELNLNNEDCRSLFVSSIHRNSAKRLLNGPKHIDYNLFGTVTGRLTTGNNCFSILTINRQLRKLIKPKNDWFLSLDYNGAEIRTFLALSGKEQPEYDIHMWNVNNIFKNRPNMNRESAKTLLFSWLYNAESKDLDTEYYDRDAIVDQYYEDGHINTIFGRKIKVDERRAFNYIIQSTTSDLVMDRAVEIDKILKNKKSFVSHMMHDELVIDLCDSERDLAPVLKEVFAKNRLDRFVVNTKAGQNYYDMESLKV